MIPERYLNFLSEISGKFPIGNFGKLPRPIPSQKQRCCIYELQTKLQSQSHIKSPSLYDASNNCNRKKLKDYVGDPLVRACVVRRVLGRTDCT